MKSLLAIFALTAQLASAGTLETVAMTIYGECADQSYAGKYAVASTIWNRANGKAAKLSTVCTARKQYSCWQRGRFVGILPDMRKPLDRASWRDCVAIASQMVDGTFLPSLDSRHYHEAGVYPNWATNMRLIARIGDHKFYQRRAK